MLKEEFKVMERWKGYFESLFEREKRLMEGDSDREAEPSVASVISMEEIVKAMKRMKLGKAAGYDRVSLEMLRAGEGIVASKLYLLFNKCWRSGKVPKDCYDEHRLL